MSKANKAVQALGIVAVSLLVILIGVLGILREFGLPSMWIFTPWVGKTWSGKAAPLISIFLYPSAAIVYAWVVGHGGLLQGALKTLFVVGLVSDIALCAGYFGYESREKGFLRAAGVSYMTASRMAFGAMLIFSRWADGAHLDLIERGLALVSLPTFFGLKAWVAAHNNPSAFSLSPMLAFAAVADIALDFLVFREPKKLQLEQFLPMPDGTLHQHAGCWIRGCAAAVDYLLLSLMYGAVLATSKAIGITVSEDGAATLVALFVGIPAYCFFTVRFSATPGKMVFRLATVTEAGDRVGPGRALLRCLGFFLDHVTLSIGFLIAAFDPKKRALHDHIARTRVIWRRPARVEDSATQDRLGVTAGVTSN